MISASELRNKAEKINRGEIDDLLKKIEMRLLVHMYRESLSFYFDRGTAIYTKFVVIDELRKLGYQVNHLYDKDEDNSFITIKWSL